MFPEHSLGMLVSHLLRRLIRHPFSASVLLLGTTLVSAMAAMQMKFDFAPQSLYAGWDDLLRASQEFKEAFGHDDSVIQVVMQSTGERDVLHHAALNWQVKVANKLRQLPGVVRVESLGSITRRRFRLSGTPGISREPLISLPADSRTESQVRDFLNRTQLTEGTLVGKNRDAAAVLVFFDPNLQSLEEMRSIVNRVQHTINQQPLPTGYRADLVGQSVLRVDIVRNLQEDQRSLIPLAGLFYFLALIFAYRRLSGSVAPLLAVGIGLAWTMGFLSASGQSFNLISNILPILLMVLGVSNSVHIISRYTEESQKTDHRPTAVHSTMRHMAAACFLTFFTTAIGFASLTTAHSDVLRAFGWQAVLGLVLLFLAIVFTLTVALPFLKPPTPARRIADRGLNLRAWLHRLGFVVTRHPKRILAASLVLMALAVWSARDVKINSYTLETYDPNHPTLSGIRVVEDRLSGLFPLEIELRTTNPEQVYQAEFLQKLAEVQRFAQAEEAVVFDRSYLNLHAEVEPDLHKLFSPNHAEILPDVQSLMDASQVRMRYSKRQMGYSAFLTDDHTRVRLLLRVRDVGTHQAGMLISRLEDKLQHTFPTGDGVSYQITGDVFVITQETNRLIRDLMLTLLTASGVIFLIIAVLFRSWRVGLLSAIPNATPLVLTLGYMGLRGYDMNVGNVIVFTISLGIAVDDTIHLLFRFREEQQKHADGNLAARAALTSTGSAMVLTSLLIVGGLGVLLFSQFVPTRRFAELLMVTMGGALVGDLLLLPACLVLFSKKPTPPVEEELDWEAALQSSEPEPLVEEIAELIGERR